MKKRYIQDLTLANQDEYTAIIKDYPYILNGELNTDCPKRRALLNELYDRNAREQQAEQQANSILIKKLNQEMRELNKQIKMIEALTTPISRKAVT